MSFYEFASGSPFLTFFLFAVVASAVVGVAEALFGKKK